jgi:hypothetical protein
MRILMLGAAAVALSGCSFLGLGGNKATTKYNNSTGYYSQQAAHKPVTTSKCHTGNCLARWNLEGGIGASFPVGNNVITASRTNPNPNNDFNSVSFSEAYNTGVRAELGGSYALAPNTKITLLGHYEEASSDGVQDLGTIGGQALSGELTGYQAYGAELGLRQYFRPVNGVILKSVRPYVEARAGVSHVDDIALRDTQLGDTALNPNIGFYEDSWVPTAAGLIGIETPVAKYTTIGLETGLRYQGGLKSDTSVLGAGSQLGGLNNSNGRLSIPLTLRGRYRF